MPSDRAGGGHQDSAGANRHLLVPVPMRMRFGDKPVVGVLMVFVVRVLMLVLQHFVRMHMLVTFGQMQPDTGTH